MRQDGQNHIKCFLGMMASFTWLWEDIDGHGVSGSVSSSVLLIGRILRWARAPAQQHCRSSSLDTEQIGLVMNILGCVVWNVLCTSRVSILASSGCGGLLDYCIYRSHDGWPLFHGQARILRYWEWIISYTIIYQLLMDVLFVAQEQSATNYSNAFMSCLDTINNKCQMSEHSEETMGRKQWTVKMKRSHFRWCRIILSWLTDWLLHWLTDVVTHSLTQYLTH